ncbi:MAG: SCP2 sterol-binding domain-containing protein [Gemmatimonadetes bacterium]|nr:SCP2 sterol-binding domain-containing protein [Gemmatimonadota bacterium]
MRTMRQTIEGMALVFDPAAAGDLEATIQFDVSGTESGVYHLEISGGVCTFSNGPSVDPTLTIATPSEVWARISAGEISGREALLEDLYEVCGDASLLTRLDQLFGRAPEEAVSASATRWRPGPIRLKGSRWLTVAFAPWLVLWFGPLFGVDVSVGLRVAFPVAALLSAYHAVSDRATWFELGSALFLGAGAVASLSPAGSMALAGWGSAADSLALGIIWLSSLLHAPNPLTAEYSRWDHAEALAANSTFLHVNRMLTFLWGAVFVVMGSLSVAALQWPDTVGRLGLVRFLLLIPAIAATIRLPRIASRLRIENMDGWRRRSRVAALAGIFIAVTALVTAVASS